MTDEQRTFKPLPTYKFDPKRALTAGEMTDLMRALSMSIPQRMYDKLPANLKRHFVEEQNNER